MVVNVLMVAEKPSIAQTISEILSNGQKQHHKGAQSVHEFRCRFQNEDANIKVTSVVGHVYTTDFPAEFNNWDRTDPLELFDARTVKLESNSKTRIPSHLAKEAKGCQHLVLWLDCDREGENICFEVIECCASSIPGNYGASGGRQTIWRAHFSSLAPQDIK
eukprot:GHVN01072722.1.p1 GENE.GHVN01072722.1~~GHVN01072722.1.p1  ORF type:complete len:162 (+),score=28.68 GHVN01072722.1:34-519(+)